MSTVSGNYRVAGVKFIIGTNTCPEYFFALFDDDVNVGDLVLCDSANNYVAARVSSITPKCEYQGVNVTKEIICKLDFSAFETRKNLRKQKAALKKQMDRMVADNQELILYQAVAEKNPAMAELLASYKAIGDV